MRRRSSLAILFAIGLFAGSSGSVTASFAAVFDISIESSDPDAPRIEAEDARASGLVTVGPGEALVLGDLVLVPFSARVVNDAGAWVGTGRGFGGGSDRDMNLWELQGEGGYEGLSLFLVTSSSEAMTSWGMIVPTDEIPPFPGPPPG